MGKSSGTTAQSKENVSESPLMWSIEDARKAVADYVRHYNEVRLHSAIGYVTPHTKLEGQEQQIFAERDRKLDEARERRQARRRAAAQVS